MTAVPLPEDGPAEIAGVSLPAGQRIYGWMEDGADIEIPAAWVTSEPMADAGDAWLALSAAHAETGLVPVLLSRAGNMEGISGEAFMLCGVQDIALIDTKSPEGILAEGWDIGEGVLDSYLAETRAPFGLEFPGLAPAEDARLPDARLRAAVAAYQPAFLGLVAAGRPADVPAAAGWTGFGVDGPGSAGSALPGGFRGAALLGDAVRCPSAADRLGHDPAGPGRAAAQHVRGRHPGRRRAPRVRRRVRQVLGPADQRAGGGSCGRAGLALLVGLTKGKP